MPHISRPYSLHLEPLHYLAEDPLYPVPVAVYLAASLWIRVSAPLAEWNQHFQALLAQLLYQLRLPIITISQAVSCRPLYDLLKHCHVRHPGWRYPYSGYDSGPTHPHVQAEAVEYLIYRMILAVACLPAKALAFRSTSESADVDGEAVNEAEAFITVSLLNQLLPKNFFELPQIGRLAGESSAVERGQGRKQMREVATEVVEYSLVLGESEILANNFYSEDFAVSEARERAALAKAALREMKLEGIVNETKHRYNEGV